MSKYLRKQAARSKELRYQVEQESFQRQQMYFIALWNAHSQIEISIKLYNSKSRGYTLCRVACGIIRKHLSHTCSSSSNCSQLLYLLHSMSYLYIPPSYTLLSCRYCENAAVQLAYKMLYAGCHRPGLSSSRTIIVQDYHPLGPSSSRTIIFQDYHLPGLSSSRTIIFQDYHLYTTIIFQDYHFPGLSSSRTIIFQDYHPLELSSSIIPRTVILQDCHLILYLGLSSSRTISPQDH